MEAFDLLRSKGIVSSESEFSESWLAHSECYLRTLRMKNAEPSIGVVAICENRLRKAGHEMMAVPRYRQLGEQFIAMSDKCRALVNADSVEFELTA